MELGASHLHILTLNKSTMVILSYSHVDKYYFTLYIAFSIQNFLKSRIL